MASASIRTIRIKCLIDGQTHAIPVANITMWQRSIRMPDLRQPRDGGGLRRTVWHLVVDHHKLTIKAGDNYPDGMHGLLLVLKTTDDFQPIEGMEGSVMCFSFNTPDAIEATVAELRSARIEEVEAP